MNWAGINPVQMSRSVSTVLFHGPIGHGKYKTGRFVKEECKSHLNAVSCFVTVYRSTLHRFKDLNGKSRSDR